MTIEELFDTIPQENLNEHYWNRYKKFILSLLDKQNVLRGYTETHHIIPKCIRVDLYSENTNKIKLTARQHFIAHLFLRYCYKQGINRSKLVYAMLCMCNLRMKYHKDRQYVKINSRLYENLRLEYSNIRKEQTKNKTFFDSTGIPSANKGCICITNGTTNRYIKSTEKIPKGWYIGSKQRPHMTEEIKQKLVEAWKLRGDKRRGVNHANYGKHIKPMTKDYKRINNGIVNKSVHKNDLQSYLNNGWVLGMLPCTHNKSKGKIAVYNDTQCIYILPQDLDKYLKNGYKKGNPKTGHKGDKNGSFNTKLMNNGIINKRVKINDIQNYLQNGWTFGLIRKVV